MIVFFINNDFSADWLSSNLQVIFSNNGKGMRRSFQQTFVGEERLRDEPKECLRGRLADFQRLKNSFQGALAKKRW